LRHSRRLKLILGLREFARLSLAGLYPQSLRGQCPQDLDTAISIGIGDPVAQTHEVMQNICQLLEESGARRGHLTKLVVYLTDVRHREAVYRTMGEYIADVHPVCTGLVVTALARAEWLVEIDATAVVPDG
jgi:enamine deaminase RidA (YjgF/YER057c/UK114 family)